MEGQMSYLQLRNDSGELVIDTFFRAQDMIVPALDQTFPPGHYTLVSYQRPFNGSPQAQDPPTDECEMDLELLPQSETFVTASFAPGEGCTMTRTNQPLQSAIPDQFVFREVLPSCGEEMPMLPVLGIQGVNPARTCFLEAWQTGNRAEVTLWVLVSENTVRPRIHRILPDRSIEVFAAPENTRAGDVWTYYKCTELQAVSNVTVFTLAGCTEPEPLSQ